MIKSNKTLVGLSPKLAENFQGPYYVSEIGPKFTYKIRRCSNHKELKSFVNALQLKHYFDPEIERNNIAQPVQQPTVQDEGEENTDDTLTNSQQDNDNTLIVSSTMKTHNQPQKLMLTSPRHNLRVKQIVRMKTLMTFGNSSNNVIRTSISQLSGPIDPKCGNHKKMLDQTWSKNIFRNTLKKDASENLNSSIVRLHTIIYTL